MSFSVEKGEFLGIISHTGSGKSTLIQHLNGLLKPTDGRGAAVRAEYLGESKQVTVPAGSGWAWCSSTLNISF